MNLSHYGQIVHQNFKEKEEGETYSSIVRRLKDRLTNVDQLDQVEDLTRGRVIEQLVESGLPTESLGQLAAWILIRTRKRKRSDDHGDERPEKKARFTKELGSGRENLVRAHHCLRCSKTASYFDQKKILIKLPFDHARGRCPLYCHFCSDKGSLACRHPEDHLKSSCLLCDSELSNHTTENCFYRRLYN